MDTNITPQPRIIDLSGLPESTIQRVLELVHQARRSDPHSPVPDDPERWSAEWRAWVASRTPGVVDFDDNRESIYAGRGE